MRKPIKIVTSILIIALSLVCLALGGMYYIVGVNYFTLGKTFNKSEIAESAKTYTGRGIFLIKPAFLKEYGQGHFPKYKIYNPQGIRLNTYACYESLPNLPDFIKKDEYHLLQTEKFETEIQKVRELNSNVLKIDVFKSGKYNMIFYYKNAMDRIQKRQLNNILTNNLGDFKDSLNVIFVNVDKVDF